MNFTVGVGRKPCESGKTIGLGGGELAVSNRQCRRRGRGCQSVYPDICYTLGHWSVVKQCPRDIPAISRSWPSHWLSKLLSCDIGICPSAVESTLGVSHGLWIGTIWYFMITAHSRRAQLNKYDILVQSMSCSSFRGIEKVSPLEHIRFYVIMCHIDVVMW